MEKEAVQFLRAYADDLRYTISQRSVDAVNFNTSGTPHFKTLNDAIIYRQKLLNVIRELEAKDIMNDNGVMPKIWTDDSGRQITTFVEEEDNND
mgnify:CR=1 FL=1